MKVLWLYINALIFKDNKIKIKKKKKIKKPPSYTCIRDQYPMGNTEHEGQQMLLKVSHTWNACSFFNRMGNLITISANTLMERAIQLKGF